MSRVELGICGPSGVRPRKESGSDMILMASGAAIAFSVLGRALRALQAQLSRDKPAALSMACGVGIVLSNRRYR